jgi:hypothetical protein
MSMQTRRLRLEELLSELGALDEKAVAEAAESATKTGVAADAIADPRLQTIAVGDIVDRASDAGFGFLIALLALIAIPFFGLSTPFGLAMALAGVQLAFARSQPWLPGFMRRRTLTLAKLDRVAALLARRTAWLSKMTRRRGEILLLGPMRMLIGVGIMLLGVGLALPLPIPGSNMIFLIPLFVYGVGLLERDGAWIMVGHLAVLANVALAWLFQDVVVAVVQRVAHWFG